jgi:NAD(P) transhydrogenase subunit beta
MNRKFLAVIAGGFGTTSGTSAAGGEDQGEVAPIDAAETAALLNNAKEVMIIPGYGMAVHDHSRLRHGRRAGAAHRA